MRFYGFRDMMRRVLIMQKCTQLYCTVQSAYNTEVQNMLYYRMRTILYCTLELSSELQSSEHSAAQRSSCGAEAGAEAEAEVALLYSTVRCSAVQCSIDGRPGGNRSARDALRSMGHSSQRGGGIEEVSR